MARIVLAIIASALLVAVLGLLIAESSTVNEQYYAEHAERMRAVEATRDDLNAILLGAEAAHKEGRSVPAGIETSLERIGDSNAVLQEIASAEEEGLVTDTHTQLALYDAAQDRFVVDTRAFVARQNALADALRLVQEESPDVVKDLRRFDLRIQSQNTFSLAIEVIEFATGQSQSDPQQIATRIEALADDSTIASRAPGRIDSFIDAARTVITEHGAAATALEKVTGSRIANSLWTLSDAIQSENRAIVSRAERARLLLSVCTLLLLGGIGFVVYRLQSSYRALNRSNEELETINNSLEERVSERTVELSSAYDDLKESQVQLVQAEKMSSLGELVAGISHEINTPLWYLINNATIIQERLDSFSGLANTAESMIAAIRSGTDVKETLRVGLKDMQAALADGLKDDLEEANDLIKDSIEGLEDLTHLAQSLKDFSRLDRAQQGQFDVNEGIDKTLLITKNKLKNKVTVHKHFGEVPEIECSPSQINQIFLNLITNAADAIEEQGEVLIRTWEEDGRVHVSVADTGCGIPVDIMDKIRNPFFTTKEVGKGTGLGLSIVDRIVESHNGELTIESEVGKGTVISVSLPVTTSAAEVLATQDAEVDPGVRAIADESIAANDEPAAAAANQAHTDDQPDDAVPDAVTA